MITDDEGHIALDDPDPDPRAGDHVLDDTEPLDLRTEWNAQLAGATPDEEDAVLGALDDAYWYHLVAVYARHYPGVTLVRCPPAGWASWKARHGWAHVMYLDADTRHRIHAEAIDDVDVYEVTARVLGRCALS